jgi:SAM-dependent methyltransferase
MKKNFEKTNQTNIEIIKKTKLDNYYIDHNEDFRERIVKFIDVNDEVLDIGKSSRNYFNKINCKRIITLDMNQFEDYPDIVFDLCDNLNDDLVEKFDKIICIAILEHVYNPFKAVENLKKILKPGGVIYGYVPYLYKYHAPEDLFFQDYFRFSKDALSYLFKDFSELTLFPVRGRLSAPINLLFGEKWKKYFEKFGFNIFFDKFTNKKNNQIQCSGYNFIVKK